MRDIYTIPDRNPNPPEPREEPDYLWGRIVDDGDRAYDMSVEMEGCDDADA